MVYEYAFIGFGIMTAVIVCCWMIVMCHYRCHTKKDLRAKAKSLEPSSSEELSPEDQIIQSIAHKSRSEDKRLQEELVKKMQEKRRNTYKDLEEIEDLVISLSNAGVRVPPLNL